MLESCKACNFIKKRQVFSCEICEIFKNTFFGEHMKTAASIGRLFRKVNAKLVIFITFESRDNTY